jgi:hypothetical protein
MSMIKKAEFMTLNDETFIIAHALCSSVHSLQLLKTRRKTIEKNRPSK